MELTNENKETIDNFSYTDLLRRWRFAPVGDPWFQSETGKYWGERMNILRSQPEGQEVHVSASKRLGWEA